MENRLQATFMPRQTASAGEPYSRPKAAPNFFMLISVVVFIFAIVALGGVYAYKGILTKSNETKKASLEEAINNFEPELTRELTVLKARMDAGKTLISNHKAVSLLFTLLELNTAQTVRFSEFAYDVSDDKKINLTLKGEARSYNAIAYQSDIFSKLEPIKNPVFSNLTLGEQGTISFGVKAEIDPAFVSYKKLVEGFAPSPEIIQPILTATTTVPTTSTSTATTTGTVGTTTRIGS